MTKTIDDDEALSKALGSEADQIGERIADCFEVELQHGYDPYVVFAAAHSKAVAVLLLATESKTAAKILHAAAEQVAQLPSPNDKTN